MEVDFQVIALLPAFVAVALSLWAARTPIPELRNLDFGKLGGPDPVDDRSRQADALRRQGRWSAFAAVAAGISVIIQALAIIAIARGS
jgi:hypothetical protein